MASDITIHLNKLRKLNDMTATSNSFNELASVSANGDEWLETLRQNKTQQPNGQNYNL